MNRRTLAWLPLVAEICVIAAYFYFVLHAGAAGVADARKDPQIGISAFSAGLVFSALGGFIAYHRPGNAFGWILAVVPLSWCTKGLTDAYTWYAVFAPHHHAGGTYTAWLSSFDWFFGVGVSGTVLLLVFPDGRLPSRRWRPVAWIAVAAVTSVAISFAFAPGPLDSFHSIRNPFGAPAWAAGIVKAGSIAFPLLFLAILASAASLFFRAHNGTPVERQQVKWLAYFSGTLIAIAIIFISRGTFDATRAAVLFGSLSTVPLASVIAITRYRLYEIDRIISRTMTYALVIVVLGSAYALVALVPLLIIGTGHPPSGLIAGGTLVVVALFRPVHRRIRDVVDRRFNRSRYDAAHTIDEFASHLRNEVDIDTLGAELQDVVGRTMQPAYVSLWLRG